MSQFVILFGTLLMEQPCYMYHSVNSTQNCVNPVVLGEEMQMHVCGGVGLGGMHAEWFAVNKVHNKATCFDPFWVIIRLFAQNMAKKILFICNNYCINSSCPIWSMLQSTVLCVVLYLFLLEAGLYVPNDFHVWRGCHHCHFSLILIRPYCLVYQKSGGIVWTLLCEHTLYTVVWFE